MKKPSRQDQAQRRNVANGMCRAHKGRKIYKGCWCFECYEKAVARMDMLKITSTRQLTVWGRLLESIDKDALYLGRHQKEELIKSILDGTAKEKLAAAQDNPLKIDNP